MIPESPVFMLGLPVIVFKALKLPKSNSVLKDFKYDWHRNICWIQSILLVIVHQPVLNSLWPSDAIWWHRSGSTLAQVMACCLTAPSHYLNQCWLIISKVQWQSPEGNLTRDASAINYYNQLENYLPKISFKSPRGQWVNVKIGLPNLEIQDLNDIKTTDIFVLAFYVYFDLVE